MSALLDWWRWRRVSALAIKLFRDSWSRGGYATPSDCLSHAADLLYGLEDDA